MNDSKAAKPDGCQYPLPGRPANRCYLLPGIYYRSDFGLLGHLQSIIHFNAKVTHGALQLGVAKKQLHRPQVFRPSIDQGCLGSPHRMCSVFGRI